MTLAYIPSPGFSAIHIGQVTIRMYALMVLLGIIAAVAITNKRWKKLGGDFDQILDIAIVSVPCGIIGARLYHVITTPERFFGPDGNPADIVKIWQGGLGIWGGILLGGLGAWAWCHHKHYPFTLFLDAVAPALLVAQGIGRLGNWFNQELYGSPTTLPWGLKLNPDAEGAIGTLEMCYDGRTCPTGDTLFHPTFLYEMLWNFVGAALLVWIGKKTVDTLKSGCLFWIYVMWYTLGRTWIEMLRIDYAHEFLGLRINVWVSVGVFLLGLVALMINQHIGQPTPLLSNKLFEITRTEESARKEQEREASQKDRARKEARAAKKAGRKADGDVSDDGKEDSEDSKTDDRAAKAAPRETPSAWDAVVARNEKDERDAADTVVSAFDRLASADAGEKPAGSSLLDALDEANESSPASAPEPVAGDGDVRGEANPADGVSDAVSGGVADDESDAVRAGRDTPDTPDAGEAGVSPVVEDADDGDRPDAGDAA